MSTHIFWHWYGHIYILFYQSNNGNHWQDLSTNSSSLVLYGDNPAHQLIYPPSNKQFAPENRPKPKRKGSSSNHPFSGVNSLLVSGRVFMVNMFKYFSKTNGTRKSSIFSYGLEPLFSPSFRGVKSPYFSKHVISTSPNFQHPLGSRWLIWPD